MDTLSPRQRAELLERLTALHRERQAGALTQAQLLRLIAQTFHVYALPVQVAPFCLDSWRDEERGPRVARC